MMLFEQPPLLPHRPQTPRPATPGLARPSSPTSAFTAFLLTSPLRPDEQLLWQSILRALTDDDLAALRSTLELADQVMALHVLLACSHTNMAPAQTYAFDQELLPESAKLLGQQPAPLSALQLTCVLGAEDSALFLLEFTRATAAAVMGSDRPVHVMMEQECGEGNTVLHLASFNALPAVVKALLKLGANPNKRNGKGIRPVDCADESCSEAFWEIDEVVTRSKSPIVATSPSQSDDEEDDGNDTDRSDEQGENDRASRESVTDPSGARKNEQSLDTCSLSEQKKEEEKKEEQKEKKKADEPEKSQTKTRGEQNDAGRLKEERKMKILDAVAQNIKKEEASAAAIQNINKEQVVVVQDTKNEESIAAVQDTKKESVAAFQDTKKAESVAAVQDTKEEESVAAKRKESVAAETRDDGKMTGAKETHKQQPTAKNLHLTITTALPPTTMSRSSPLPPLPTYPEPSPTASLPVPNTQISPITTTTSQPRRAPQLRLAFSSRPGFAFGPVTPSSPGAAPSFVARAPPPRLSPRILDKVAMFGGPAIASPVGSRASSPLPTGTVRRAVAERGMFTPTAGASPTSSRASSPLPTAVVKRHTGLSQVMGGKEGRVSLATVEGLGVAEAENEEEDEVSPLRKEFVRIVPRRAASQPVVEAEGKFKNALPAMMEEAEAREVVVKTEKEAPARIMPKRAGQLAVDVSVAKIRSALFEKTEVETRMSPASASSSSRRDETPSRASTISSATVPKDRPSTAPTNRLVPKPAAARRDTWSTPREPSSYRSATLSLSLQRISADMTATSPTSPTRRPPLPSFVSSNSGTGTLRSRSSTPMGARPRPSTPASYFDIPRTQTPQPGYQQQQHTRVASPETVTTPMSRREPTSRPPSILSYFDQPRREPRPPSSMSYFDLPKSTPSSCTVSPDEMVFESATEEDVEQDSPGVWWNETSTAVVMATVPKQKEEVKSPEEEKGRYTAQVAGFAERKRVEMFKGTERKDHGTSSRSSNSSLVSSSSSSSSTSSRSSSRSSSSSNGSSSSSNRSNRSSSSNRSGTLAYSSSNRSSTPTYSNSSSNRSSTPTYSNSNRSSTPTYSQQVYVPTAAISPVFNNTTYTSTLSISPDEDIPSTVCLPAAGRNDRYPPASAPSTYASNRLQHPLPQLPASYHGSARSPQSKIDKCDDGADRSSPYSIREKMLSPPPLSTSPSSMLWPSESALAPIDPASRRPISPASPVSPIPMTLPVTPSTFLFPDPQPAQVQVQAQAQAHIPVHPKRNDSLLPPSASYLGTPPPAFIHRPASAPVPDLPSVPVPSRPSTLPHPRLARRVSFDPLVLLTDACLSGDLAGVRRVFEPTPGGLNSEPPNIDTPLTAKSLTPLHLASSYGHTNIARYLVEAHGADVNAVDGEGWTPMHCAAAEGFFDVLEYLVGVPGVKLDRRTEEGETIEEVAGEERVKERCLEIMMKARDQQRMGH